MTRDHAGDLGRRGKLVNIGGRDERRVLSKTLQRASGDVRIDVERLGLQDGDRILLCTNGLTDFVDDGRIADILRATSTPDEQSRALVDLAIQSQGQDDVTAVVAKYRIRPWTPR